jgi:large subunit ribosomal protein L24
MVTRDASKQRKRSAEAPLHVLRKSLAGHLSKELREKYKKRSLPLRKGDIVLVKGGKYDKKQGKVTSVDTNKRCINVEGLQISKKDGKTIPVKIEPSNVIIIELYKDDEKRFKHIKVK